MRAFRYVVGESLIMSIARIKELLDLGDVDEALRELRRIEIESGSDDTNSVLMTAVLARTRLRERQQQLSVDQIESEKAKFGSRLTSIAAGLVGQNRDSESVRDVLLLIHGIQSRAGWFEMVRHVMQAQLPCEVIPVKYDYFDIARFAFPIGTRRFPVRKIAEEIRRVNLKHPNARLSAIAHSFGTYALVRALDDPTFELSRVILCGSILSEQPRLQSYFLNSESARILNDYGTRDIWPVLAKCLTWGFGATGTFGFGTVGIRDRAFPFTHHEFFSAEFVSRYWVPFIRDGTVVPPPEAEDLVETSQALSILGSPMVAYAVRLVFPIMALSLLGYFFA